MYQRAALWVVESLSIFGLVTACGGDASTDAAGGSSGSAALGQPAMQQNASGAGGEGTSQNDANNGGDKGAGGATTIACTRTEECAATCAANIGACLLQADGGSAVEEIGMGESPLAFEATVKAISKDAWPQSAGQAGCLGSAGAESIHVSLEDGNSKAWDLSLNPEQVAQDRFSVGDKLAIDYDLVKPDFFDKNQRLIIRVAGKVDLFFLDNRSSSFPSAVVEDVDAASGVSATDDTGLTFSQGAMTCPFSVPNGSGCSTAKSATVVSAGTTSLSDPCAQDVGDFTVTAQATSAGQAPPSCGGVTGFCDAVSTFFAAGARHR